jgi:hypothetical protein
MMMMAAVGICLVRGHLYFTTHLVLPMSKCTCFKSREDFKVFLSQGMFYCFTSIYSIGKIISVNCQGLGDIAKCKDDFN